MIDRVFEHAYAASRAPSATAAAEFMAHLEAAHAESKQRGFEAPFLALVNFLGTKILPNLFDEAAMALFKDCKRYDDFKRMRSNFIHHSGKFYPFFVNLAAEHAHHKDYLAMLKPIPGDREPTNDALRLLYLRRGDIWHGVLTFLARQDPKMTLPYAYLKNRSVYLETDAGRLRVELGLENTPSF